MKKFILISFLFLAAASEARILTPLPTNELYASFTVRVDPTTPFSSSSKVVYTDVVFFNLSNETNAYLASPKKNPLPELYSAFSIGETGEYLVINTGIRAHPLQRNTFHGCVLFNELHDYSFFYPEIYKEQDDQYYLNLYIVSKPNVESAIYYKAFGELCGKENNKNWAEPRPYLKTLINNLKPYQRILLNSDTASVE